MRSNVPRLGAVLVAALLTLIAAGSGRDEGPPPPEAPGPLVPARFLPAPPGTVFQHVQWLPGSGDLVVVGRTGPRGWDAHLYRLAPDGTGFAPLPLPDDPDCKYTSQEFARALSDGRLAFRQRCWVSLTPARRLPAEDQSLLAYDPASGAVERLLPYYLPPVVHGFDFAPDQGLGVIANAAALRLAIWWLRPDRLEPIALPLDKVGGPGWSPDGAAIALVGAPPGSGADNPYRLRTPRKLYLLSPDTLELRPLVEGLTDGSDPAWSPDGRWLALWMRFPPELGGDAVWLVEAASGRRYRLVVSDFIGTPAWSPDGATLAIPTGFELLDEPRRGGKAGLYLIDRADLEALAAAPE